MAETSAFSPLSGGYLLIVLTEPHSEQHKQLLLERLAKGLASWDSVGTQIDIESELRNIVAQCPHGEEVRNGEKLIQLASDSLVTEILIHPQLSTLKQCMRNLLASFTRHRHVIHAGYTLSGSGSWILQDGTYEFGDFLHTLADPDIQRLYRAYESSITMDLHCADEGQWTSEQINQEPAIKAAKISVNPASRATEPSKETLDSFVGYISDVLPSVTLDHLLEPSDVVGNIRFSHPTLYVFPGGQGDSALFGISGFNILVDGGFGRKPCFWDFTRHLDRLDAVVMTRNNSSSLSGLTGAICRKASSPVYPQMGHIFCNLPDNEGTEDNDEPSNPLTLRLNDLCRAMSDGLGALQLKAQPIYRTASLEPINLYHKVGHGTLDMFIISPSANSADVKELMRLWRSGDPTSAFRTIKMGGKEFRIPLLDVVSVCALLVWQPADPVEPVTRLLFPGSAPQHKILEGLEKFKGLEFLRAPVCTAKEMAATPSSSSTPKSPVKSKSTTSPRHTASEPVAIKSLSRKEASKPPTTISKMDQVNNKEAETKTLRSAAKIKAEALTSSSRSGSTELRLKKSEPAKTAPAAVKLVRKDPPADSNKTAPPVAKIKKDVANMKMVEAKVNSFKTSAPIKRVDENLKNKKVDEIKERVSARSQSQSREKRSASSVRSVEERVKLAKKMTDSPTSPAKTTKVTKLKSTKPVEAKVPLKEVKKDKPSATPKAKAPVKEAKSATPATKATSPAAPSSKAVKRPVKPAVAPVATAPAPEEVPVAEESFKADEAPQAASSPIRRDVDASDQVPDEASVVASIEDQILVTESEDHQSPQADQEPEEEPTEEAEQEAEQEAGQEHDVETEGAEEAEAAEGAEDNEPVKEDEEEEEVAADGENVEHDEVESAEVDGESGTTEQDELGDAGDEAGENEELGDEVAAEPEEEAEVEHVESVDAVEKDEQEIDEIATEDGNEPASMEIVDQQLDQQSAEPEEEEESKDDLIAEPEAQKEQSHDEESGDHEIKEPSQSVEDDKPADEDEQDDRLHVHDKEDETVDETHEPIQSAVSSTPSESARRPSTPQSAGHDDQSGQSVLQGDDQKVETTETDDSSRPDDSHQVGHEDESAMPDSHPAVTNDDDQIDDTSVPTPAAHHDEQSEPELEEEARESTSQTGHQQDEAPSSLSSDQTSSSVPDRSALSVNEDEQQLSSMESQPEWHQSAQQKSRDHPSEPTQTESTILTVQANQQPSDTVEISPRSSPTEVEEEFKAEIVHRPVPVTDPSDVIFTPEPATQVKPTPTPTPTPVKETPRPLVLEQSDDDDAEEVEEEAFHQEIKNKDSAVPITPTEKQSPSKDAQLPASPSATSDVSATKTDGAASSSPRSKEAEADLFRATIEDQYGEIFHFDGEKKTEKKETRLSTSSDKEDDEPKKLTEKEIKSDDKSDDGKKAAQPEELVEEMVTKVDSKPVEETKPVDTKPAEEPKLEESKSVEPKQVEEHKTVDTKAVDEHKSVESKPIEEPKESKVVEETKTSDTKAVEETKMTDAKPVEEVQVVDAKPVEEPKLESKLVEETKIVDSKLVEDAKTIDTKPEVKAETEKVIASILNEASNIAMDIKSSFESEVVEEVVVETESKSMESAPSKSSSDDKLAPTSSTEKDEVDAKKVESLPKKDEPDSKSKGEAVELDEPVRAADSLKTEARDVKETKGDSSKESSPERELVSQVEVKPVESTKKMSIDDAAPTDVQSKHTVVEETTIPTDDPIVKEVIESISAKKDEELESPPSSIAQDIQDVVESKIDDFKSSESKKSDEVTTEKKITEVVQDAVFKTCDFVESAHIEKVEEKKVDTVDKVIEPKSSSLEAVPTIGVAEIPKSGSDKSIAQTVNESEVVVAVSTILSTAEAILKQDEPSKQQTEEKTPTSVTLASSKAEPMGKSSESSPSVSPFEKEVGFSAHLSSDIKPISVSVIEPPKEDVSRPLFVAPVTASSPIDGPEILKETLDFLPSVSNKDIVAQCEEVVEKLPYEIKTSLTDAAKPSELVGEPITSTKHKEEELREEIEDIKESKLVQEIVKGVTELVHDTVKSKDQDVQSVKDEIKLDRDILRDVQDDYKIELVQDAKNVVVKDANVSENVKDAVKEIAKETKDVDKPVKDLVKEPDVIVAKESAMEVVETDVKHSVKDTEKTVVDVKNVAPEETKQDVRKDAVDVAKEEKETVKDFVKGIFSDVKNTVKDIFSEDKLHDDEKSVVKEEKESKEVVKDAKIHEDVKVLGVDDVKTVAKDIVSEVKDVKDSLKDEKDAIVKVDKDIISQKDEKDVKDVVKDVSSEVRDSKVTTSLKDETDVKDIKGIVSEEKDGKDTLTSALKDVTKDSIHDEKKEPVKDSMADIKETSFDTKAAITTESLPKMETKPELKSLSPEPVVVQQTAAQVKCDPLANLPTLDMTTPFKSLETETSKSKSEEHTKEKLADQLKPDVAELSSLSASSSTSVTPKSPLSPNIARKSSDHSDPISKTIESISGSEFFTAPPPAIFEDTKESKVLGSSSISVEKDVTPAVSSSSSTSTTYLAGYEGVNVSSSKLSTIASSDGEVDGGQPSSLDSNWSSKTFDKLTAAAELPRREPEESAFSSGPSSWDDREHVARPFYHESAASDRSATSSITSHMTDDDISARKLDQSSLASSVEPLTISSKKELDIAPISPAPSSPFSTDRSSSHGDFEANKDSLSSIQTSASSDYHLETKVDDSASAMSSTRSDCSGRSGSSVDPLHAPQQEHRSLTPRSELSSTSETSATIMTTTQIIQPGQQATEVKPSKAELADPKVAPHNIWLKEKDTASSPNPFSDQYVDDDSDHPEQMEHASSALYYHPQQSSLQHLSDVDSDRQSQSSVPVAEYTDEYYAQHMAYVEASRKSSHPGDETDPEAEVYLYESEHDDHDPHFNPYATKYSDSYDEGDVYHTEEEALHDDYHHDIGDHQNGNSYHYYETSERTSTDDNLGHLHDQNLGAYESDLNRNDRTPSRDNQQPYPYVADDVYEPEPAFHPTRLEISGVTTSSSRDDHPLQQTSTTSTFSSTLTSSTTSVSTSIPSSTTSTTLPSSQTRQQHEETLASWGKPLGLPTPVAPVVYSSNGNGLVEAKKTPSGHGSPIKRPASSNKTSEKVTNGNSSAVTPFYVDLAYIPHHSDPRYSDVEFFRRVRARHYVLSSLEPSAQVLDALLEGKQSWTGDDKDLDVTIIPTYDSDALAVWVSANEDLLARNRIDLAPSASRCTINLQDHETSCSAYRLEF